MVSLTFKFLIAKSPDRGGLWAAAEALPAGGSLSPERKSKCLQGAVGLLFEGTGEGCVRRPACEGVTSAWRGPVSESGKRVVTFQSVSA